MKNWYCNQKFKKYFAGEVDRGIYAGTSYKSDFLKAQFKASLENFFKFLMQALIIKKC